MLTFGILGGMGPMATVDLFSKIIQNTPARFDQEHIRIIIDNHPQIPARITAIMEGTESPLLKLIESAKVLEQAGATTMAMACNTAHYWFDEVQQSVNVPMIHLIDNAAVQIKQCQAETSGNIMLLATSATVKTELYQPIFSKRGMDIKLPDAADQKIIAATIDEIKSGHISNNSNLKKMLAMMEGYSHEGISAFIGGCTELPLVFPHLNGDFEKYDPTLLLAKEVVRQAISYSEKSA